MIVTEINTHQL